MVEFLLSLPIFVWVGICFIVFGFGVSSIFRRLGAVTVLTAISALALIYSISFISLIFLAAWEESISIFFVGFILLTVLFGAIGIGCYLEGLAAQGKKFFGLLIARASWSSSRDIIHNNGIKQDGSVYHAENSFTQARKDKNTLMKYIRR